MTTNPPKKTRSPRKARTTKPAVDRERTAKEIEHPPTEKPVLVREDPVPFTEEESPNNKYGRKPKVGTPTLGRTPNYVTTVGLGKLEVMHAESNKTPYDLSKHANPDV